jgi:sulfite reductase (ferredoxin)
MLLGAKALVKIQNPNVTDDPDQLVSEFRTRFFDTQLFWDPFSGGKFAQYFFDAHQKAGQPYTLDSSRYLIDEAQLFIDAAHSCNNKLMTTISV